MTDIRELHYFVRMFTRQYELVMTVFFYQNMIEVIHLFKQVKEKGNSIWDLYTQLIPSADTILTVHLWWKFFHNGCYGKMEAFTG
jgi:hypothetical protein